MVASGTVRSWPPAMISSGPRSRLVSTDASLCGVTFAALAWNSGRTGDGMP